MKYIIHSTYGGNGGPHALHQLSAVLSDLGKDVCVVYPPVGHNSILPLWTELYGVTKFLHREHLKYEPDQIHISPANWGPSWHKVLGPPQVSEQFAPEIDRPPKVFYWLGVTPWQDWDNGGYDCEVNLDHPNIQKMYHACQSKYAYNLLMDSKKIDPHKIFMLRCYTNPRYIHSDYELFQTIHKRSNIVLYNGSRGTQYSRKIMDACADLHCIFVKLENMTQQQIKELALKSKIYIDFGQHTGKDRIPREMAICGCIVITGNENAAITDIPIGSRRFSKIDGEYNYELIRNQIKHDLDNYVEGFFDESQTEYRMSIRKEKNVMYDDVRNMINLLKDPV